MVGLESWLLWFCPHITAAAARGHDLDVHRGVASVAHHAVSCSGCGPLIRTRQVLLASTFSPQIASLAVAARLSVTRGALVQSVVPGSAAARAGLLPTRRGLGGIITGADLHGSSCFMG